MRQTLYIASANAPEEHVALVTQHRSPIRFLEWAPITLGGPFLLSADAHEKICVWEMKDSISEWEKLKIFDLEGTVGLKWLNADPKVSPSLSFLSLHPFLLTPPPLCACVRACVITVRSSPAEHDHPSHVAGRSAT
jgi:hypothetical protein